LLAYRRGVFPMADSESGELGWYSPDPRAVIPLDRFHVPRSLVRLMRQQRFELRTNTAFEAVMRACAEAAPGRESSWIDERLIEVYAELHRMGAAHSIEAWRDGQLVGGLYGVHLGRAFCGESMFSRPESGGTDASKVCLARLVDCLSGRGFELLDTQFLTPHLARFGCVELPRARYLELLAAALEGPASRWPATGRLG
jgi:leucyl/phenylalanyl-tRNA--protein transferase